MTRRKRILKEVLTVDLVSLHEIPHLRPDSLKEILFELKYRKKAASVCKTWTSFQMKDWKAAGNIEEWTKLIEQLPKTKYLHSDSLVFDIYAAIGMYSRDLLGVVSQLPKLHSTESNKIIKMSDVLSEATKLHLTTKKMVWSSLINNMNTAIQQYSLSLQADVDNAIQHIEHQLQHPKPVSI